MIRSLLSAFTVWALGCVVPAPLSQEGEVTVTSRPAILSSHPADFRKPYGVEPQTDGFMEFVTVFYDGPFPLLASLYSWRDNVFRLVDGSRKLDRLDNNNNTFTVQFSTTWCGAGTIGHALTYVVYVTDGTFNANPPQPFPDNQIVGNYDFKTLVIECLP